MKSKREKEKEQIALGKCVSPLTVDRCSHCIDCCEAFWWRIKLDEELKKNGIDNAE